MKCPIWVHAFLMLILSGTLQPAVVAGESPGAARVLRVKAVADEAFRDNKNWEKEIRQHFAWADEKFRMLAGIGLELVAIERWTTHESKSMALLLNELRVKVDKGDADIVVGFTGHKAPKVLLLGYRGGVDLIRLPHIAGIALALGDRAVVRRDDRFKKWTRHTLLHEIAHLFGGLHVKEKSILYTTSKRMDFALDPFNQRVFELTRQRDFNRHIRELGREELNPLINLYSEAPLRHERDFDTHIRIASLLLAAGEVDAAIEELEQAIDINPIAARPIFRGAIIPELEAYAEEHGTTTQIRYALGRAYSALREWEKAAHHLSSNCYTEPPHALSCSELGAVLLVGGKEGAEGAEEALRAALRLDESLMKAHNNLAILYAVLGRRSEALAHLNRATELRPDDPSVYHNMGMTYLKLELLEPAADAFRHTLELNAKDEKARSKLAVTLARQGETKQARQLIKELLERPFLPAVVFRDIAEIFFRDGDTKLAWKSLGLAKKGGLNVTALEQEMLAGAPKPRRVKTSVLIEQAKAYYEKERYDPARSLLEQARTQEPGKEGIHYWLGRVARAERKPDGAARHQQRAIELNKKYASPHLELGRLAFDRKDYASAISHLNRYVELAQYPGSQAFFLLGKSRYQQGDFAAAEENLKKAIQRNSKYSDAFYVLALVYGRQGRREEAMAELKLAIDSRSLSSAYRSAAHYNLAVLCYQTGQHEQAWKHARIAQVLGYTDMAWLLAELAKVAPEPSGADEQRPSQD